MISCLAIAVDSRNWKFAHPVEAPTYKSKQSLKTKLESNVFIAAPAIIRVSAEIP